MIVAPLADGRILVDRQALAALLQRSCETIARYCTAEPDGAYDVDRAQAQLDGAPDVVPITAHEAQQYLGIARGTVRSWASRGRVHQVGHRGVQALYDAAELSDLAATVRESAPATVGAAPGRGQPGERSTCRTVPKNSAA